MVSRKGEIELRPVPDWVEERMRKRGQEDDEEAPKTGLTLEPEEEGRGGKDQSDVGGEKEEA